MDVETNTVRSTVDGKTDSIHLARLTDGWRDRQTNRNREMN